MFSFDKIISRFQDNYNLYPVTGPELLKKHLHLKNSSILYVFFPPWAGNLKKFKNLEKNILKASASFLSYDINRSILSCDTKMTLENFKKIESDIVEDIKKIITTLPGEIKLLF